MTGGGFEAPRERPHGDYDYLLFEDGNVTAGSFDAEETGADRYALLEMFNDVSNTDSASSPGSVHFYPMGVPFVDPGPEGMEGLDPDTLARFNFESDPDKWTWFVDWWQSLSSEDKTALNAQLKSMKVIRGSAGVGSQWRIQRYEVSIEQQQFILLSKGFDPYLAKMRDQKKEEELKRQQAAKNAPVAEGIPGGPEEALPPALQDAAKEAADALDQIAGGDARTRNTNTYIARIALNHLPGSREFYKKLAQVPLLGNLFQGASVKSLKLVGGAAEVSRIAWDTGGALIEAVSGGKYQHEYKSSCKRAFDQAQSEGRGTEFFMSTARDVLLNGLTLGLHNSIQEGIAALKRSQKEGDTKALQRWAGGAVIDVGIAWLGFRSSFKLKGPKGSGARTGGSAAEAEAGSTARPKTSPGESWTNAEESAWLAEVEENLGRNAPKGKSLHFPENPQDFSKQIGVPPSKVGTTPDATLRMEWRPSENVRIRYESHPGGSSAHRDRGAWLGKMIGVPYAATRVSLTMGKWRRPDRYSMSISS